jgi:hypothetical protein
MGVPLLACPAVLTRHGVLREFRQTVGMGVPLLACPAVLTRHGALREFRQTAGMGGPLLAVQQCLPATEHCWTSQQWHPEV